MKPNGLKNAQLILFSTLYAVVKEHGPKKQKRERVVGRTGLEPVTPALSRRCSNQLSYMPVIQAYGSLGVGGGKETRTPDIKLAKLALYQLSYTPAHIKNRED